MKYIRILLLLCAILFTGACSRSYYVTTDTYADNSAIPFGFPIGTSFAIKPAVNKNPLFAKEVSQKIENLIQNRGYQIAGADTADYLLEFTFDMSSEKVMKHVLKEVPSEKQTRKRTFKNGDEEEKYEKKIERSCKNVLVPEERTYYSKELSVVVYDKSEQIWNGSAKNCNSDQDLRETLDYLLVSVFSHFGKNTKKSITTSITEDDLKPVLGSL